MVSALSLHKAKAAFIIASARKSRGMATPSSTESNSKICIHEPGGLIPSTNAATTFATLETKQPMSIMVENDRRDTQLGLGPIHFCFIVHGHKGHANDLWYLHQTVRDKAKGHDSFHQVESSEKCIVGANLVANKNKDNEGVADPVSPTRRNKRDRLSLPQKLKAKLPTKTTKANSECEKTKCSDSDSTTKESELSGASCLDNIEYSEILASSSSFIVHNAICNEDKTDDGIINGGCRLADEILEVIRHEVQKKKRLSNCLAEKQVDVTLSLIGNSLGGLYTRYAVAKLAEIAQQTNGSDVTKAGAEEQDYYIISDRDLSIRLHFNVFCTTASPHLGCSDHTYFPIPRVAEKGIAYGMGETGRDLFRVNNLLHDMATSKKFLEPLSRFRKRVAYANAFGTDFVVPTQTAAFLDEDSHSLHYFDEYHEEDISQMDVDGITKNIDATTTSTGSSKKSIHCHAKKQGLVIATFHTKRIYVDDAKKLDESIKELTLMSSTLDSLGWEKVFVDIRKEIPLAVSIPIGSNSDPVVNCPVQKLRSAKVVESRELAKAVSRNPSKAMISLPLGHNAIVAMSRGAVTLAMNGGGMPVVDSLALHLADDISSWTVCKRDLM